MFVTLYQNVGRTGARWVSKGPWTNDRRISTVLGGGDEERMDDVGETRGSSSRSD